MAAKDNLGGQFEAILHSDIQSGDTVRVTPPKGAKYALRVENMRSREDTTQVSGPQLRAHNLEKLNRRARRDISAQDTVERWRTADA